MLRSPPTVLRDSASFRAACDDARARGARVGFVPTMGALHEGHLELVTRARATCDFVVVSIFVNPTQFGPNEDFARYPRDEAGDLERLASVSTDAVFLPTPDAMYPAGERTRVHVGGLGDHFCGPFRPGHFEGVATIVAKFFGLVGQATAVFGRKDYQQLAILRRLATDLFLPITVVGVPTVRESDGLAKSSRNRYLTAEARAEAVAIPRALAGAHARFAAGERHAAALVGPVRDALRSTFDSVDYADLGDPDTLVPFPDEARVPPRTLLAVAVRTGTTRLIDNVVLGEDRSPVPEGS
ncbi:MAG: pantoate--beta-alanine ligase [Polyangiaceae bacterium]